MSDPKSFKKEAIENTLRNLRVSLLLGVVSVMGGVLCEFSVQAVFFR
jgi:hypothetical protein